MGRSYEIGAWFASLATEQTAALERGLSGLDSGGAAAAREALGRIRAGAAMADRPRVAALARAMEDLLELVQAGEVDPGGAAAEALSQAQGRLAGLLAARDPAAEVDIGPALAGIRAALEGGAKSPAAIEALGQCLGLARPGGEPRLALSRYTLEQHLSQGNIYHLNLTAGRLADWNAGPCQALEEVLGLGRVPALEVTPDPAANPEAGGPGLELLLATVLDAELMAGALRLRPEDFRRLDQEDFTPTQTPCSVLRQPGLDQPAPAAAASPAGAGPATGPQLPEREAPGLEWLPEYLSLQLGDETYAVDILAVQEIINLPPVTRLPRSPDYVLGVINLRGMVVPVIDLRRKLGLPAAEPDEPVVMVMYVRDKIVGAVVDRVKDVVEIDHDWIQEAPPATGPVSREFLRGLYHHEDEMLILIDLDRMLAGDVYDDP